MRNDPNAPIVAIDIDGTLGDYHAHFLRFAQEWYGRPMPTADEINPGLPLHKFMHTSKTTYRACKLAYRQGGLERSMPVYPGARELTVNIRKAGAQVWVCTTRPYLKYDQLYKDTLHWLRRHRIPYDAVIHGERKYRDLARIVSTGRTASGIGSRVAAVLDDLPEMCQQATDMGLPTLLRDQPYNRHWRGTSDLFLSRVFDMEDAAKWIDSALYWWEEANG